MKIAIAVAIATGAICAAGAASAQDMTCTATRDDVQRLSRLPQAWEAARKDMVGDGQGDALRRLGPLADPRIDLSRPHPTPGRYQCRTIKLGSASKGMPPYLAYGWFRCTVELTPGGDLILKKTSGSQRQAGLICPDGQRKTRFVGTLALGDETGWPRYGADPDRNVIGEVRRIGEERWRVAFPWPAFESKLDLLELRRVR